MRNRSVMMSEVTVVARGTSVTSPGVVQARSAFRWYACPTNVGFIRPSYTESNTLPPSDQVKRAEASKRFQRNVVDSDP